MPNDARIERAGIYNTEFFSGAQCSLYIGDVWVDEVTTLAYGVQQSRRPLYGYADQLFRDVAEGQVLVQGQFSINFKEAGYLFLILDRYRQVMRNESSLMDNNPFLGSARIQRENIERIINQEVNLNDKNSALQSLAEANARASLGGFASETRASGGYAGAAEKAFEAFEDKLWKSEQEELDSGVNTGNIPTGRRADDPRLNPFDIYVSFGDFQGDNSVNHTMEKIAGVRILGKSKQIVIDGQPIQEAYSFIARNLI